MNSLNLILLNSLLVKLPNDIFQLKMDPNNKERIQELESIKTKISSCIDTVVSQSPDDLVNYSRKLKQKWEKYSAKFIDNADIDTAEMTYDIFHKSHKLVTLIHNICQKAIAGGVSNLTQPNNENASIEDIIHYQLQKQAILHQSELILRSLSSPQTAFLPNDATPIVQQIMQEEEITTIVELQVEEAVNK